MSFAQPGGGVTQFEDALHGIRQALAQGEMAPAAAAIRSALDPGLDFTAAQSLYRQLKRLRAASVPGGPRLKIAVLSNFMMTQFSELLDLYLFGIGIDASIYLPDYGMLRQEVLDPSSRIYSEKPSIVVIASGWRDLTQVPAPGQTTEQVKQMVAAEVAEWASMWKTLHDRLGCQVIQNNFDAPPWRTLGNHEAREGAGLAGFIARVNLAMQDSAPAYVTVHDLDHLSASHGRWTWGDERYFHLAKIPCAPECQVDYAHSVASLIAAQQGLSKKCLVLDLDNTLWGGVIGDDGLAGIRLGQGDAEGEAFLAFQRYAKGLRSRGIILAVCSKNEHGIAKEAFDRHPDMILRYEDIACFVANWNDKAGNLRAIASQLNIGLDALVFVDDNPAERSLVRRFAPEVVVPELPPDPADFVRAVDRHRYFQTVGLSAEDYRRADFYKSNAARAQAETSAAGLDQFLQSLQMTARVGPINALSLERSTQLINKSNQFNLTTRRRTQAEVLALTQDPSWITLTVSLADRFGDNGLISVLLARIRGTVLEIDTWLMSCRVLRRGVEHLALDLLCAKAAARGCELVRGEYIPTAKNALVAEHYRLLGFKPVGDPASDGRTCWDLALTERAPLPAHIEVLHDQ